MGKIISKKLNKKLIKKLIQKLDKGNMRQDEVRLFNRVIVQNQ